MKQKSTDRTDLGLKEHDALQSGIISLSGYSKYVLVLMMLVYAVNWLDRQILGILIPQIKAEFHVLNWEIGALTGPAFAIVYAITGIPIAMFSDRFNRRNVIVVSVAVFSTMTLLPAWSTRFWQLFVVRIITGIGEAGTSPAITSMLADLFPAKWRASALAFYASGASLGILLAFFFGGLIADRYGWRDAFLAAGIAGGLLAVLIISTVREPLRGQSERLIDTRDAVGFLALVRQLWSQRSYRWIVAGAASSAFGSYSSTTFVPLFLKTSHGMTLTEIGTALALLMGIGGAIGSVIIGRLSDYFGRNDLRGYLYVLIGNLIVTLPFVPVYFLAASKPITLIAAILPSAAQIAYTGPVLALSQMLVPLRMRAGAVACELFVANIVGLSSGPLVVGIVSDLLRPVFGTDSLRFALMITMVSMALGAICFWRSSITIRADVATVTRGQIPTRE